MGLNKGWAIGQEIGFYSGLAQAFLSPEQKSKLSPRIQIHLESLLSLTASYPSTNDKSKDLLLLMQRIRAKAKLVVSGLGLPEEDMLWLGKTTDSPVGF